MKTNIIFYGIKDTANDELLGVSTRSNGDDAEFCNESTVEFSIYEDMPWLTKNREDVERALAQDINWYNSSTSCPCWNDDMKREYKANGTLNKRYKIVRIDGATSMVDK